MDYIQQLNAFELWLETNYLPGVSQLIWYKLFMLFNRCGWVEWVTVDNFRLMALTDIKSETTFINNRDKLINAHLIEFQKGKKGTPNKYKMAMLYTPKTEANNIYTPKFEANTELIRGENDSQNGANIADINKLNKTKLNQKEKNVVVESKSKSFRQIDFENPHTTTLIKYFVENIDPRANPINVELLCSWLDVFDESIIKKAIDESIKAGGDRRNIKYIGGILKSWQNKGLTTLSTVQGYLDDWENKKNNVANNSKFTKQLEAIKEWQPRE